MKKKTVYTDEPLEMEVIEDFLPPPEKLVRKAPSVKVTISLSETSVDFFKRQARKNNTQYQKMIRRVSIFMLKDIGKADRDMDQVKPKAGL